MDKLHQVIRSTIVSLLAAGLAAGASPALAKGHEVEKCAGIVKAGKNDCGTSHSSCHGSIQTNGDREAWIEVPKGTCDKIVGGYVTTSPYARPGGKQGG